MTWKKWLIRGIVLFVLAAVAAGGGLFSLWTNPEAVRQLVQEKLGDRFIGVGVQVGTARMRLLGGILVRELRLARSDGLDHRDFLYVPSAVISHDKEQLLSGAIGIRRVELDRPQLRIVRERDGSINVQGILGPVDLNERLPAVVIREGVVLFEDRGRSDAPILEVRKVQMTMVNDPLPILQIEGAGHSEILGPVRFKASIPRATFAASIEVGLSRIPLADVARHLAEVCPGLGTALGQLSGVGRLQVKLRVPEQAGAAISHDITAHIAQARFHHALLPRPLEQVEVEARLVDGVVPLATLTAASGPTRITARAENARWACPCPSPSPTAGNESCPVNPLSDCFDRVVPESLDVSIAHLPIDDSVLSRLPAEMQSVKEEYSPSGLLSLRYRHRRGPNPCQEWILEPEGMSGSFHEFPYPISNVRGTLWIDVSNLPRRNLRVELTGTASGQPVSLRGTVKGKPGVNEVILDIRGTDIRYDDRLMRALSPRVQKVVRQFLPEKSRNLGLDLQPMGRGDFDVLLRRKDGEKRLRKTFTVTFRDTSVQYDQFPYPLENVEGVLILHPDHWEARGFRGRHAGGEMFFEGHSQPLPGRGTQPTAEGGDPSPPERVHIRIRGKDILLDHAFETALVPTNGQDRKDLQSAWRKLRLAGRLNFAAEVVDHPGQPQNIDVSADVHGCSMRPAFFDYALDDLSGSVRYAQGRLDLRNMRARHGKASLGLVKGVFLPGSEGGFRAWLEGMTGHGLVIDHDLLHAMPETLRQTLEGLRLRTPLDMATKLTIVGAPGPGAPAEVWWEGAIGLKEASFRPGVEVTKATGQLYTKGYHDGRRLRWASGQVRLESSSVVGQPVTNLYARMDVEPSSPEVLRIRDLRADLFGGALAGEACLHLSPIFKYDVMLEAISVQLDVLGRHNLTAGQDRRPANPTNQPQAQLQGTARASLHVFGEGNDLLNLKGNGRFDVPQGKMGQLPVLLDLIKAFGLRIPDKTAFEQAQMVFAIEGPQVLVRQLDLFGNAVSLRGQGTLDLDGSNLNLDFTATPGRITQMLPAGIDLIPQAISGQLLKIKMRGKLGGGGKMKFDQILIPGVVEPLERVLGN